MDDQAIRAFESTQAAIFGLYIWEILVSMNFEWDLLTGKKRFRLPLIFYFANRYFALGTMIAGFLFLSNIPGNCGALYIAINVLGKLSVGMAGINLSLRTIALWARNRVIIGILTTLSLIQLGLLVYHGTSVSARRITGVGCVPINSNYLWLKIVWAYTLFYNTVVLVLSTYKLRRGSRLFSSGSTNMGWQRASMTQIIFRQGLMFYILSFLTSLLALIFLALDLSFIMLAIVSVIAEVFTAIIACRSVRSLTNLPYEQSGHSRSGSGHAGRLLQKNPLKGPPIQAKMGQTFSTESAGWQVETELKPYPVERLGPLRPVRMSKEELSVFDIA